VVLQEEVPQEEVQGEVVSQGEEVHLEVEVPQCKEGVPQEVEVVKEEEVPQEEEVPREVEVLQCKVEVLQEVVEVLRCKEEVLQEEVEVTGEVEVVLQEEEEEEHVVGEEEDQLRLPLNNLVPLVLPNMTMMPKLLMS